MTIRSADLFRRLDLVCRTATTFAQDGSLDEVALRAYLARLVRSGIGLYLGSGGSGEGHVLTRDELRRVYAIGLEVGKGKVPVYANPPEGHSAEQVIAQTKLAFDSGVEVVNVYGPSGLHGFRPTDHELSLFYDDVLAVINGPVAIAPNPVLGYSPTPSIIASIADRHEQVVGINLSGTNDSYFVELRDRLKRTDVRIFVPVPSSLHTVPMGAAGLLAAEANIIPATFRRYLDLYAAGDVGGMATPYADILKFTRYVSRWHSSSPRWLKMAIRVLRLPGWQGAPRSPYQLPPDDELQRFREGLLALRIAEIEEIAGSAV